MTNVRGNRGREADVWEGLCELQEILQDTLERKGVKRVKAESKSERRYIFYQMN